MRRRRLRPAFCMTGHSQQSAVDVRRKHPGRQNVPESRLPGAPISSPGTSQQVAAPATACRSGGGRFGNSLPRGNCGCQLQMPVTAADGSRCSRLWTVDCGLRVVDHKLWIATGKVKIISLTSTLWRRAEHRPVRLMEPFSFHQTPDGTIFLPSNSPAPSLRQLQAGRCSQ